MAGLVGWVQATLLQFDMSTGGVAEVGAGVALDVEDRSLEEARAVWIRQVEDLGFG